jgi:hypothetical protein
VQVAVISKKLQYCSSTQHYFFHPFPLDKINLQILFSSYGFFLVATSFPLIYFFHVIFIDGCDHFGVLITHKLFNMVTKLGHCIIIFPKFHIINSAIAMSIENFIWSHFIQALYFFDWLSWHGTWHNFKINSHNALGSILIIAIF